MQLPILSGRTSAARPAVAVAAAVAAAAALLAVPASSAPPAASTPGAAALAAAVAAPAAVPAASRPLPSDPGISPGTSFTPVSSQVLTTPQPVRGSDGRLHLTYELVLTNPTAARIEVERVAVTASSPSRVLRSLTGADLEANANPLGRPRGGPFLMEASTTWVVWLDVIVRRWRDVPAVLVHRVRTAILTPDGRRITGTYTVAKVPTLRRAPVVLGPPLLRGRWFASEGCCDPATHHRGGIAPINGQLLVPQRFAIDWYRLDRRNRAWVEDPGDPRNYFGYRQPIIAAAAGKVVAAFDGLPNNPDMPQPPPIPPIRNTVGNHVIVRHAPGVHTLYAHLDPGSVKVRTGQAVRKGQMLGRMGSSGNSTTPHLHFQVLTTPTFFPADSRPWMFERFELLGRVLPRIWDDDLGLQPTGQLPVTSVPRAGPWRRALPLDRTVIRFGARSITPPARWLRGVLGCGTPHSTVDHPTFLRW